MIPNICNKKTTTNQEVMKIDDDDVCVIMKEIHKRNKFDKEFDIELISECECQCEYDDDPSKN